MCSCNMWLLFSGVVVFCALSSVVGFNVDTVNFSEQRSTPGSSFGFSVALHKEVGESW